MLQQTGTSPAEVLLSINGRQENDEATYAHVQLMCSSCSHKRRAEESNEVGFGSKKVSPSKPPFLFLFPFTNRFF